MKFPSISRIPKYKKFNFTPRYYDPIKEDVKNRMARIQGEISEESNKNYRESIKNAFETREKQNRRTDLMQLIMIALVVSGTVAWIYYGNIALYVFLPLFVLYIYLRSKRFFQH